MNPPTTATTAATPATTQARSLWARASDAALVALPGVLLLAITVGRTPGMIADSHQYYAAATTLARSGTLVLPIAFSAHEQFDAAGVLVTAHPLVLWPPGYPLALAFFMQIFSLAIAPFFAGPVLGSTFLVQRWVMLGCALCAERLGSGQSLAANIRDLVHAMVNSLPAVYELAPGPADTIASLAIVLAVVAVAARWRPLPRWSGASAGCRVALAFALTYVVGVVALRTAIEFNSLDARLVAPAAIVLLSVGVGFAFSRMRPQVRTVIAALLPIVAAARAQLAREPDVPLFTPDATIVQAFGGIDRPVYFLPPTGVPPIGRGARAIAMVRPSDTPERRALIQALDGAGTRTLDRAGVIAWELQRRPE